MAKKVVKKTKVKIVNLLLVLLVLVGLFFGVQYLLQVPIHNIIIKGNDRINDDVIIDLAGIKKYPAFLPLSYKKTCNKILKSPYIETCKMHKKWGFILEFDLKENRYESKKIYFR